MPDIMKTIKGLECCNAPNNHKDCPYNGAAHYNICTSRLLSDATSLLKAQEPREVMNVAEVTRDLDEANTILSTFADSPCEAQANQVTHRIDQAIALLKAQQARIAELEATQRPRIMTLEEVKVQDWDYCYLESERRPYSKEVAAYCGKYRIACVTWPSITHARITYGDDEYGKAWRVWTSRPTDGQREVVPWKK